MGEIKLLLQRQRTQQIFPRRHQMSPPSIPEFKSLSKTFSSLPNHCNLLFDKHSKLPNYFFVPYDQYLVEFTYIHNRNIESIYAAVILFPKSLLILLQNYTKNE